MSILCPQCSTSLKLKYMRTTVVENNSWWVKLTGKGIPTCPNCGALLERKEHPFDKKILSYISYPFAVFAIGLISNQTWLKYTSALLLVVSIAIIYKKITSKEYKAHNVWHIYQK